jgi:hypothetical protein
MMGLNSNANPYFAKPKNNGALQPLLQIANTSFYLKSGG